MDIYLIIGYIALGAVLTLSLFEIWWVSVRARRAVKAGKEVQPVSQVSSNEVAKVLVVGDSTAYGTGATEGTKSLVGRLALDFPQFTIINESVNAMRVDQAERKLATLSGQKFDVVIIHIGGMDTLLFTSTLKMKERLQAIFTHTKNMGAKVTILVSVNNVGSIPLFHFPLNRLYGYRSRLISGICDQACMGYGIVHVPLFFESDDDPLINNGQKHFASDGIHPNDFGYEMWYYRIKSITEPHLEALYKREHIL